MSDKIDLWELPYEGKTVYVLLAARGKVSALADSENAESLALPRMRFIRGLRSVLHPVD